MIRVGICDDDKIIRDELGGILNNIPEVSSVRVYKNGNELYDNIAGDNIDLLFLDIMINDMNGISIKDNIEKSNSAPYIAFITSHSEFMPKAFGRKVIGYVGKPIDEKDIQEVINRYKMYEDLRNIVVENIVDNQIITLSENDIVYIKIDDKYSEVFTVSERIVVRKSLIEWMDELSKEKFCKISRKVIVNFKNVDKMDGSFYMKTGDILKPSRANKKESLESYLNYVKKGAYRL